MHLFVNGCVKMCPAEAFVKQEEMKKELSGAESVYIN